MTHPPLKVVRRLGKFFNKSEKMGYNAMIIWGKDMEYLKLNHPTAWMKLTYGEDWKKIESKNKRLAKTTQCKV